MKETVLPQPAQWFPPAADGWWGAWDVDRPKVKRIDVYAYPWFGTARVLFRDADGQVVSQSHITMPPGAAEVHVDVDATEIGEGQPGQTVRFTVPMPNSGHGAYNHTILPQAKWEPPYGAWTASWRIENRRRLARITAYVWPSKRKVVVDLIANDGSSLTTVRLKADPRTAPTVTIVVTAEEIGEGQSHQLAYFTIPMPAL